MSTEQTQRRLRDLTTISEIGLRLSSEMDIQALLDLICFYGTVLLEAERAVLLLIDGEGQQFVVRSAYGLAEDAPEMHGRPFSPRRIDAFGVNAENRFGLLPEDFEPMTPLFPASGGGAAAAASILGKRGMSGLLVVHGRVSGEAFGEYDGEVLQLLVAQAGIAIENAEIIHRLDALVDERTAELAREKDRSLQLLRNILPADAVEELLESGQVTPRRFDSATVMFTDFCEFTSASEQLLPEELLLRLNEYYERFDETIARHGLERLKTIGDSYMCVGGVPAPRTRHAVDCVSAALELLAVVDELDAGFESRWNLRVGIHSGPLVAGVVGRRRFAYDVWGDTVNVASRMESLGVPGRVNVSADTWRLVRDRFDCEARGRIEVKGKGALEMYLVAGPRDQRTR